MQRWRTDPLPPRVILTAVGIQSPFSVHRHALYNGETSVVDKPDPSRRPPRLPPVILTAVGIQSPFRAPPCPLQRGNTYCGGQAAPLPSLSAPTYRHSHRSGNPEPFPCATMPITTGKHLLWASRTPPLVLVAACPWTPEPRQRTKGALDSHCGENDGGDCPGEYCSTKGLMESARPVSTRGAKLKSLPRLHLSGSGPVRGIGIRG